MNRIVTISSTLFFLVSGFLAPQLANAQLEEIIVTATKREMNAQDTNLALTVIDERLLDSFDIQDVAGLGDQIPSLIFGNDNNDWKAILRGIGTDNVDINSEPGVALHVDGVYLARPSGFNALTYDVQRIEVVRGPQGTLYGRNATGGAINVVSNPPQHEFSARADILTGEYDRLRVRGVVNVPLADQLAVRLSVVSEDRDGYQTNINPNGNEGNDADNEYFRGQLLWEPTDNFSLTTRVSKFEQRDIPARINLATPQDSTAPEGGFMPDFTDLRIVSKDHLEANNVNQDIYSFELNIGTKSAEITAIMGISELEYFLTQDADITIANYPMPGGKTRTATRTQSSDQFVMEVRLSSLPDSPIDWLVGAFFMDEDADGDLAVRQLDTGPGFIMFTPFASFFGTPPGFTRDIDNVSKVETTSGALFGDVTYQLNDRVSVTGGLRYTRDSQDGVGQTQAKVLNFFSEAAPLFRSNELHIVPAKDSWSKTTWKLGLIWDVADDRLVYLTASTGFRSGGFNFGQTDPDKLYYEPEDLHAIELGSKNLFNDGRVKLNFSAFYYDYEDLQVFQLINDAAYVQNAAEAEIKGIETEFLIQVSDQFQIDGHLSLLDATYKNFISEDQVYPRGRDGIPFTGDELFNLSGNDLVQAPDRSGLIGLSYIAPIDSGATITLRAQVYSQSETYLRQFNLDPYDKQDSYTMSSITFRYDSANQNYYIYGGINNIEDEDVIANIDVTPPGGYLANMRAPRSWYIGVGAEF